MHGLFRWGRKWWPGLIPLAALWVWAAWSKTVPIESDLTAAASAAVKNDVLDKISITAAGRDITFAADAFSEEGRRSAVTSVESIAGVRMVNDRSRLVPEAKPYVWTAERDVVRVTLGGSTPLPAIKARLLEAARSSLNGVEVVDHTSYARGAPARFDAAVALLIEQVARLKEGKVGLSDKSVSLSGMARELGGREAIAAALRSLPEGYTVAVNQVEAPPYIFQANKDPVGGTLTLSGNVPNNPIHDELVGAAQRKFFGEKVSDSLKPSIGAPKGFTEAVMLALGALSRLSTGALVVADREVKLSGDALYPGAANQIRELGKSLPEGWRAKTEISVKPASAPVDAGVCQRLFSELLAKGSIRFETGSATIDADSAGLLDRLAEIALRCPAAAIEVVGHTDSDGDEAANQALSETRAKAVVDFLVQAGLPADRFQAVGMGSSQPTGDNATEAGKAQNRRIDFLVR